MTVAVHSRLVRTSTSQAAQADLEKGSLGILSVGEAGIQSVILSS